VHTSIGDQFAAMETVTLGAQNSAPKVGPVVVSEIMNFPVTPTGEDENLEFIELENILSVAQPLFDETHPPNTWGLRGAVRYQSPTGVTLATGERILVVGFDPANSTLLASFRARYAPPANVRIFGPWGGALGNTQETVRLIKPGAPIGNFFSDVDVDYVEYSSSAPWPLGRIGSDSFQRISSVAFGNDPVNWKLATPTAGRSNVSTAADSDNDGLPDDWEIAHFGNLSRDGSGDFDGDGLSDLGEFQAGTDPNNASDALRLDIALGTTDTLLRFNAVTGHAYRVEFTDDLLSPTWQLLQDVSGIDSTRQIEITAPIGTPKEQFYRVVLQ
jgi:hypothetical protein